MPARLRLYYKAAADHARGPDNQKLHLGSLSPYGYFK
jgi:hypothetical protein